MTGPSDAAGAPCGKALVEPAVFDTGRLAAVARSGLLASAQQDSWDGLTALAARLLRAPMAFLTVVDHDRSFWLATCGVDRSSPGGRSNTVAESFCQYVIADRAPLVVADAAAHPRTAGNPSVAGMGVRAWAGFPVLDRDGHALGSFCVMDVVPRAWSDDDVAVLGALAEAASSQIALLSVVQAEARAQAELEVARDAEVRAQARLDQLANVTLQLLGADTLEGLAEIIIGQALAVLGVDGGAVLVREQDRFSLAVSGRLPERVQVLYGDLPLDSPLPACHVGRTGERVVLPDRAAGLAFSPVMEQVYADTERPSWAFLPLELGGRVLGCLAVAWEHERERIPDDELDLIAAFAAQCTQALERIRASQAERDVAADLQRLSEALQRSLLTQPRTDLEIAVRYLPAVQVAQVGGDWHDAYRSGEATLVSVGDVAGHDRNAAAGMAQLRNLLRGLALHGDDGPAELLRALDRAIDRLDLDLLATALVGRLERSPGSRPSEGLTLRWSSAGHLPPLLRLVDGTVTVLDEDPDPLLGVVPDCERREHVTHLPPASVLLLCTDGLVERRGESLTTGLQRLTGVLADTGSAGAEQVCEAVLSRMLPRAPDDDVALLVLRVPCE